MKQDLQIRKSFRVLATLLLLLLMGLPEKAWAQDADGSQGNPYPIDLTNPTAIANVMTMDEVTVGSNKYKRINLLAGANSADARVYYKLTGVASIADKVILWNYLKNADNTESTASHITLLVDGSDVSLYGIHLGGDVSLEADNGEGDKLTISGRSSYSESPYSGGSGYALSFMADYHFQIGEGLRVEVTSLDSNSDNYQPFPDVVNGTFTINGTLMGGINSSSVGSSSTASTKIAIAGTNNAILQIDVPNGVQSESLILKKKEGDTFTNYLTLPTKIAADNTKSINTYSICVPAGTYQCWDGDAMLEQFNNGSKDRIKTAFEAKANAVTLYRFLCLPFDLSTIKEATTFQAETNVNIYWKASAADKTDIIFSRLTQSAETVSYPVTFSNYSNSTRYLLCSSNINIEVSGEDPALTFGADIAVKFIQENDATKPLEKPTITIANTDNKKRALLVNGYSYLYGSLIVNGSVRLEDELCLYGSLKIDTPEETPNITIDENYPLLKIWLYPDDKDRYVSLSDYRDDDGNVIPSTVSISPAENISELTFSYIAFDPLYNGVSPTAKVQPGLTLAIKPRSSGFQLLVSKHTSNGYVENSPLIPVNDTYSYQIMEEDAKFESLFIVAKNLSPYDINGPLVPFTLTCDKHGIWTYTTVSSNGTYTDLFNGTLTLNKHIGKDAGDQPIDVIVEGDTEGTLILDAVALRPTSGAYAIKVNKGKLKISPKNSNPSTIIPPVKDGVYQPALLVAEGASCEVTANSGNIRFYGEAKAEETGIIKGLVQLQWTDPIDKEVQITEKGKTELAATFPALPDASPKPSILAWNPNANSTNWSKEYIVKKDDKQQVGKNSENKEVTSFAYSSNAGNLTAFTGLRDISAGEMVGEANVGASGTDVTITDKEYLVKTPIGLAWIAAVTNKKLTTGDAAAPSENGFAGCTVKIEIGTNGEALDLGKLGFDWVPIGSSDATPFKGTFEGQFHLIKNLPFAPCGLIGVADGATISNVAGELIESNSEISGSSWGGLVGTAKNGTTIKNCFVKTADPSATITLAGNALTTVGGVAGTLAGSSITDCFSTLNLSVPDKEVTMGGVAGVLTDGATVSNGYCAGSLSAPKGTVAGIVGAGSAKLCLTLSPSITGKEGSTYRVASTASSDNNYASSKTLLNGAAVTSADATSVHGAVVYTHDYKGKTVDKWTSGAWGVGNDGLYLNNVWGSGYWSDSNVPVTDYLAYELVTIDATVTYSENLHKSRDLVIKPTGVLDCPSGASVHDVTIEPGGQITEGSSVLKPNKLIVPREIKNQWTTFYSPASDLKASALSFALYRNTGYITAADKDQSWTKSDVAAGDEITIKQSSPYLLSAESAQTVTFTADKPSITLNSTLGADGPAINTGIFLFKGNPRFHNVEMKNIYVLSADGSCFDLQATYTLKPFECYILANAQTQSLVRSLYLDNMPTGIDQPLAAMFRLWSSGGQLCLSTERDTEVMIVNVAGQVVYHQRVPAGEERITLPSGIYFVRGEGITYKIKL